jgi:hypothetical protein
MLQAPKLFGYMHSFYTALLAQESAGRLAVGGKTVFGRTPCMLARAHRAHHEERTVSGVDKAGDDVENDETLTFSSPSGSSKTKQQNKQHVV